MIRTNIHLRRDQRDSLATLARVRENSPAEEVRIAIDAHLALHRTAMRSGAKMPNGKKRKAGK